MKEITFEDLQKANELIKTMDIKRKNKETGEYETKKYAQVNERIKAFRSVYPTGFITTDIIYQCDDLVIVKATAGYYEQMKPKDLPGLCTEMQQVILATGTAYEREGSSFINNTSYIENAETSAIGRCMAMCGFGIDSSIASVEEVNNVKAQDEKNNKLVEMELKEHQKLEEELDRLIALNNIDYELLTLKYKTDDIHLMNNRQLKNAIDNINKFDKKVKE